ncbi:hypothetical protein LguiB_030330 [Lonicera macranthoides]
MYRETMMNTIEANGNIYNTTATPLIVGYGGGGLLPPPENLLYGSSAINNFVNPAEEPKAANSSGCLTCALPPFSRKRSRDFINPSPLLSFPTTDQNQIHQKASSGCTSFTFLGRDISMQIQQQQLEIDCFIAQHTEVVRVEIENRQKQNWRRILGAMEEGVRKIVRVKEEKIEKIGKMNWTLEEKVKSLCVENQIWRDLAQTNEATANALRCNLEQLLLAQLRNETTAVAAESCCDSNYGCGDNVEEEKKRLTLVERRDHHHDGTGNTNSNKRWWCRKCGKVESCVLLLPCRHLCVCSLCESLLQTCPICKSSKNASLHVNLSPLANN